MDEKTSKTNMTLDKNNKQLKMYDVYIYMGISYFINTMIFHGHVSKHWKVVS